MLVQPAEPHNSFYVPGEHTPAGGVQNELVALRSAERVRERIAAAGWYANQQMSEATTFGTAVSDARKKLGVSQKQLALQINKEDGLPISPQYLNDIERDRRNAPSHHLILEFARVLQLNADYLFALAQAWPKDIAEKMSRSSPEEVEQAFVAFRRTLK